MVVTKLILSYKYLKLKFPIISICLTPTLWHHLMRSGDIDPWNKCWKVLEAVASHLKSVEDCVKQDYIHGCILFLPEDFSEVYVILEVLHLKH